MKFEYLKLYENIIPKDHCDHIINEFENSSSEYIVRDIDGVVKFTEINLNKSQKWEGLIYYILDICNSKIQTYKKEFNIDGKQFPSKYGFEEIRIKRYLPNNYDEFSLHVDSSDIFSCKRHISFLFYLNDVDQGGETVFGDPGEIIIKPKAGNLLMFPPLWTYLHAGKKPISGPKYIITTYVNYV